MNPLVRSAAVIGAAAVIAAVLAFSPTVVRPINKQHGALTDRYQGEAHFVSIPPPDEAEVDLTHLRFALPSSSGAPGSEAQAPPRLVGLFNDGEESWAYLEEAGKLFPKVKAGDEVNNWTVTEIAPDHVLVTASKTSGATFALRPFRAAEPR